MAASVEVFVKFITHKVGTMDYLRVETKTTLDGIIIEYIIQVGY